MKLLPIFCLAVLLSASGVCGGFHERWLRERQEKFADFYGRREIWNFTENYVRGPEEVPDQNTAHPKILACYFEFHHILQAEEVPPNLCTHLILIGNGQISSSLNFVVTERSKFQKLIDLKQRNPNLKLMLSLTPVNRYMTALVKSSAAISKFSNQVVEFLTSANFDGFDVDWEFPGFNGPSTDITGFVQLLRQLRTDFDQHENRSLILSAAVAAPFDIVAESYDVPMINRYVDFINIMNYDFHDYQHSRPFTGYNAPLFKKRLEFWLLGRLNTAYSTLNWYRKGMDHWKILVGMPTYGRGYKLAFSFWHTAYAPATGVSNYGDSVGYPVVCHLLKQGFHKVFDPESRVPYIYKDKQWINYDDVQSLTEKVNWVKAQNFRGAMVFILNTDAVGDSCDGNKLVLTRAINQTLFN